MKDIYSFVKQIDESFGTADNEISKVIMGLVMDLEWIKEHAPMTYQAMKVRHESI